VIPSRPPKFTRWPNPATQTMLTRGEGRGGAAACVYRPRPVEGGEMPKTEILGVASPPPPPGRATNGSGDMTQLNSHCLVGFGASGWTREKEWQEEARRCRLHRLRCHSVLTGDGVAAAVFTFFGRGRRVRARYRFAFDSLGEETTG
jgi:hypothetical protein